MWVQDIFKLRKWVRARKARQFAESLAIGVNSTVDQRLDLHIVMLDYDRVEKEKVLESIRELQDFWNLADAHVYRTKHGFHVLLYEDQVPYERLRMIVDYGRYIDPVFKYVSRYHDHRTLRVAGKNGRIQDIVPECVLPGKRSPTKEESERGLLKRQEHQALLDMRVLTGAEKGPEKDKDEGKDKDKPTSPP